NDSVDPFALRAKLRLGVHPALRPWEQAPTLERLWEAVFAGAAVPRSVRSRVTRGLRSRLPVEERRGPVSRLGRGQSLRLRAIAALAVPRDPRSGGQLVVKSVSANLYLDWLIARWRPRVLL